MKKIELLLSVTTASTKKTTFCNGFIDTFKTQENQCSVSSVFKTEQKQDVDGLYVLKTQEKQDQYKSLSDVNR